MVDVQTYKLIHRSDSATENSQSDGVVIEVDETDEDNEDFILRLPAKIKGFHMQEKKWYTLSVDGLKPVEWNEDAFKNLAVDNDTKELVQALVTNKIEADRGTDVVPGKGTGLIMLLHGGPGTGKTLTAESVAEIARKPLYRVTCGDVGTNPKAVENYLESVFQLGRTWGCVVLLDEAEVFLEERSTLSLERNALVSVFLRVLEYYDGILLLTTNRVGTFDEAFRSRIQLALHYEMLNEKQRRQIWNNFIQRLEYLNEDMDVEGIKNNIQYLASWRMNGRQIRNVITTARQLAKFQKRQVTIEHFDRVIRVCKRFDDYLADVKDAVELEDQQEHTEITARLQSLR
jgi:SpoVK/Ycf46/Vps4 family AAA+-type ATPase